MTWRFIDASSLFWDDPNWDGRPPKTTNIEQRYQLTFKYDHTIDYIV